MKQRMEYHGHSGVVLNIIQVVFMWHPCIYITLMVNRL